MSYTLFVGDIHKELADDAKSHDPSAYLITKENYNFATGTVYTCIADMESLELFFHVCKCAEKIFYCPPETWSDQNKKGISDQKKITENILIYFSQFKFVHNLPVNQKNFLTKDYLQDTRKTDDKQLWIAGCSITDGRGIQEKDNWKTHVSNYFGLQYTDLSVSSSSIQFASDQICRSDIKKEDLVFWECTAQERYPAIHPESNELVHINPGKYVDQPEMMHSFDIDRLDEPTLQYQNVLAVRRAVNFCKKIGAKLVILGVMYDFDSVWQNYNVTCYRHLLCWPDEYLDLGTDNLHPGPLAHKMFANEFLTFYHELYD